MVTVDPERDTPVLADYVQSFVPGAHAIATDDQAALQSVAGPFGVSYEVAHDARRRGRGRPLQLPVRRRRRRPAGDHVAVRRRRARHVPTTSPATSRQLLDAMSAVSGDRPRARRSLAVRRRCSWRWRRPASPSPTRPGRPTTSHDHRRSPPADTRIDVRVVGGDSFLRLVAQPGNEVLVARLPAGAVPALPPRRRRRGEPALADHLPQRRPLRRRRRRRPAPTRRCRRTGSRSPPAARSPGTTTGPTG